MRIKYIGPKKVFHGFDGSFEKDEVVTVKDANLASQMVQHPYFEEEKGKSRQQSDKEKLAESLKAEKEAEIHEAEEDLEEAEAKLEEAKN